MLKADALKFATTFRSQLPHDTLLALFPALIALLGSESNVVHRCASACGCVACFGSTGRGRLGR